MKENTFYPLLFLNEVTKEQISQIKIEDQDEITAPDGTVINMKLLKKQIESAKVAIITDAPLFAPYVNEFIPIFTWYISTMATDGVRLFVNPLFAKMLEWEQKIFVILHEIMHCVLMHQERGQGFDSHLFNIAGDFEINTALVDTLPDDFTEEFVHKLEGLYDKQYVGMAAEHIYRMIDPAKFPPPPSSGTPPPPKGGDQPPQGGKGQPSPPPKIQITPGMKVRIKSTGKVGVVSKVNPDGTYDVDPLNESFYPIAIFESYKRDEIIPILPGNPPPSQGGAKGQDGEEVEYEGQPQPSQEDGEGDGEPGKEKEGAGKPGQKAKPKKLETHTAKDIEIMKKNADKNDVGRTGSIISRELGEKIAKASGYADDEMGKDADPRNNSDQQANEKWRQIGRKIMEDLPNQKGFANGHGKGLYSTLKKLYKGEVNWKNLLRRYMGKALSPEKELRIGNKKYLTQPYLRYYDRPKQGAVKKIVVLVDVSGSMSDELVQKILSEINYILFSKRVKEVVIAFFDNKVFDELVQKVKPTRVSQTRPWLPKQRPGSGSTSFVAALDWIKTEFKDQIQCLVFATDGEPTDGQGIPPRPKYADKFIWLIYGNPSFKANYGRIINLDE